MAGMGVDFFQNTQHSPGIFYIVSWVVYNPPIPFFV